MSLCQLNALYEGVKRPGLSEGTLPKPSADERARSEALAFEIIEAMEKNGGAIPFSQFFEMALYHPELGYYTGSLPVFGAEGDFITAPLISPYFSFTLANQLLEILPQLTEPIILEIGAGDGTMAKDILLHLKQQQQLPKRYTILERSPHLRAIQRETIVAALPEYIEQVEWLDNPPQMAWQGVILANEVIDALTVERFTIHQGAPHYIDVGLKQDDERRELQFVSQLRPADEALRAFIATQRENGITFMEGYQSEYCAIFEKWFASLFSTMERGAALFIDYGYEEREYYRPERNSGTLLAHLKHHAHENFYIYPGLQDLTANVNFSQVAEVGLDLGLDFSGYTTQSFFLLGAGLQTLLEEAYHNRESDLEWFQISKATQELISPESMGERFKVIAFGKEFDEELSGFSLITHEHLL